MRRPAAVFSLAALSVLAAFSALFAVNAQPATGEKAAQQPIAQPGAQGRSIVVYCGRSKSLVEPLLKQFTEQTGVAVEARYADTADLATLIVQEGKRSPADIFFAQDPGALGAVEEAGLFSTLPDDTLARVPYRHRSTKGAWIGASGRARVLAYSTERVKPDDLPASVFDLTDPKWRGRVGWAPTNASFQLFVTAMRQQHGEERTRRWLLELKRNGVHDYASNRPIIQGIADGRIDVGLVNHYYLAAFKKDRGDAFPVENHFMPDDLGGLLSVAGAGVLASSRNSADARRFVEFLVGEHAQRYFAEQTGEFPLAVGADCPMDLGALGPKGAIDLGSLHDLRGTLKLLRDTGVLP